MNEITKQTRLICNHNISTLDELNVYQNTLQKEYDEVLNKRRQCYYSIRRCKLAIEKESLKAEAKSYTPRIKELRNQVKLCEGIKIRSIEIQGMDFDTKKQVKNR